LGGERAKETVTQGPEGGKKVEDGRAMERRRPLSQKKEGGGGKIEKKKAATMGHRQAGEPRVPIGKRKNGPSNKKQQNKENYGRVERIRTGAGKGPRRKWREGEKKMDRKTARAARKGPCLANGSTGAKRVAVGDRGRTRSVAKESGGGMGKCG